MTYQEKISKTLLKMTSGEFDLESIHTLVLHDAGISDLGCICECTGLQRLDLSHNSISKLQKLAGLTSLQFLNLSANRLTSIDGLQLLENLRNLNIAGNLIGGLDCLRSLCGLEHLKELRLKDDANELSNPVCMHPSYTADVIKMLPGLFDLDGHRVRGQGSDLFYICQEMDKDLNNLGENKEINIPLVTLQCQQRDSWSLIDESNSTKPNKAEEQLKDLLTSCTRLNERAAERLRELQNGITTIAE